jgi:hypothetical protein
MPVDLNKLEVAYKYLAHYIQLETSCANPYLTAFIDTAAMVTLLTSKAPASPNTRTNLDLKYQHPAPSKPQHAPYKSAPIQFRAWVQTVTTDTTAPLSKECIKCMQDIVGTLLYYGHADGPTIPPAISTIPSRQAQGTEAKQANVIIFLIMSLYIPMQASITSQVT